MKDLRRRRPTAAPPTDAQGTPPPEHADSEDLAEETPLLDAPGPAPRALLYCVGVLMALGWLASAAGVAGRRPLAWIMGASSSFHAAALLHRADSARERRPPLRCTTTAANADATPAPDPHAWTVVILGGSAFTEAQLDVALAAVADAHALDPGTVARVVVSALRHAWMRDSEAYVRARLAHVAPLTLCEARNPDAVWRELWRAEAMPDRVVVLTGVKALHSARWLRWVSGAVERAAATAPAYASSLAGFSLEEAPLESAELEWELASHVSWDAQILALRQVGDLHIAAGTSAFAPLPAAWTGFLDWFDSRSGADVRWSPLCEDRRRFTSLACAFSTFALERAWLTVHARPPLALPLTAEDVGEHWTTTAVKPSLVHALDGGQAPSGDDEDDEGP